jgi:hypothetical protein
MPCSSHQGGLALIECTLVIDDPTLQANRFARILAEPQSLTFRQGIDNPPLLAAIPDRRF